MNLYILNVYIHICGIIIEHRRLGASSLVGYYRDTASRAFRYGPKNWGYTVDTCRTACANYKYFALQAGSWCSCDSLWSHITKYGAYPGNCGPNGGSWCNTVYVVTPR